MMGSASQEIHHLPPELQENIEELYPGFTYKMQESILQMHQGSGEEGPSVISNSGASVSQPPVSMGESSLSGSGELSSELALDEVLARILQEQEFEDAIDHSSVSEPVQTDPRNNAEEASAGLSVTVVPDRNQDDIDPDRMTYEELQALGEAIGTERRGLLEREISRLPCYQFKTRFFSKKVKTAECVICFMEYENKQYVTTLPCKHQYHSDCINRWLRENKTCPVCQKEVTLA